MIIKPCSIDFREGFPPKKKKFNNKNIFLLMNVFEKCIFIFIVKI